MKRIMVLLAIPALSGCLTREEEARVISPAGDMAAVIEVAYAPTVCCHTDIYLQTVGGSGRVRVASFYDVRDSGVSAVWVAVDVLELRFSSAYQGDAPHELVELAGRRVKIRCLGEVEKPDRGGRCAPPEKTSG